MSMLDMDTEEVKQIVREEIRRMLVRALLVVVPLEALITIVLVAATTHFVGAQVELLADRVDKAVEKVEIRVEALPAELEERVKKAVDEAKPEVPKIPGLRIR